MATTPQPLRPPAPPAPPRSESHIVAIALLILALIVLVSAIAVWTGFRFLARNVQVQVQEGGGGKKEVSIKTPFGALEVQHDANEASLGLPIYPGATRIKSDGSATVNVDIAGEQNLRVVAAKFETPDPLEKVKDFYQARLGNQVTKFIEKSAEGKTVFEIKRRGLEKVVALRGVGDHTRIELVRVAHGREEGN